ncbi:hypothetical protein LTR53_004600 [Teratosphaeriaceae sp. CCFEE 6253]|nr:hypothetical protein LTR53_004600 [Teratosphaeriaceae sp. CCFEE 6253]
MHIWCLPPSLLVAVFLSLACSTTAATSDGNTSTSTGDLGAYIVSGLGGTTLENDIISASATTTDSDSALARAQSCVASYSAFSSSVSSYEGAHGHNTTVLTTFAYTYTSSVAPASTHATSLTTLCDGHARVVGRATTYNASASLVTSVDIYNYTASTSATTYPGATPTCSVSPDDCDLLWSAYRSELSVANEATATDASYTPLFPPTCLTAGATPTCSVCQIVAESARVMYWEVKTVPGSGDLCNRTAKTVTAGPTGPPRSVITNGITITSPTVGISFGGLSRMDGCGTTVANTIILANPEEIATVRGYHAFFSHWQFNFADLNYICASNASSNIPMDARDDCYQAVPADVYFAGEQEASDIWMLTPEQRANLTIGPDYHPRLLPPETMMPMISSLWAKNNDSCTIYPLGVWDPPIVLQAQDTVDGPSDGTVVTVTTSSGASTSATTPAAAPIQYTTSSVPATALPETASVYYSPVVAASASTLNVDSGSSTNEPDTLQTGNAQAVTTLISTSSGSTAVPDSQTSQDAAGVIASLLAGGANSPSHENPESPQATEDADSTGALTGSYTSEADSAAVASATSPDAVVTSQYGDIAHALVITLGSSIVTVKSATAGGIAIGTATLAPGDPAQTIGGQYVSAGTEGLVVGSGISASTVVATQGSGGTSAYSLLDPSSATASSSAQRGTGSGLPSIAASDPPSATAPTQTTNGAVILQQHGMFPAVFVVMFMAVSIIL